MYKEKKVIVIMPAYNAEHTLRKTYDEVIGQDWVDQIIVVDDNSQDDTVAIANTLPNADVYTHEKNSGYGPTKKHVTGWPLRQGGTSSSWYTRITSIHPN